jgi:hypothetical protein
MRQKTGPQTSMAEKTIKDIRRATRKHHSLEEKIRIVLEGLRGEDSIAAIFRTTSKPSDRQRWRIGRVCSTAPAIAVICSASIEIGFGRPRYSGPLQQGDRSSSQTSSDAWRAAILEGRGICQQLLASWCVLTGFDAA